VDDGSLVPAGGPVRLWVIWLIGWIVSGFVGKRERSAEPERSAVVPERTTAEAAADRMTDQ